MKYANRFLSILLLCVFPALLASQDAQQSPPAADDQMARMIALSKPGPNHALLGGLVGNWNFAGKHFGDDPNDKALEFKGTFSRRPIWGGRFFITETTGEKIKMSWSNGAEVPYKDMSFEGYNNIKQKFVRAMINNHWDTGIFPWEGTYDSSSKTISFDGEVEPEPGTKIKTRLLLRIVDRDHYIEEGYEDHGGRQVKVTELNYTRSHAK